MDTTGAMDLTTDPSSELARWAQDFIDNADLSHIPTGTDQDFMNFEFDLTQDDPYVPEGARLTRSPSPRESPLPEQTGSPSPQQTGSPVPQQTGFLLPPPNDPIWQVSPFTREECLQSVLEGNRANLPQQTQSSLLLYTTEQADQVMANMPDSVLDYSAQEAGSSLPDGLGTNGTNFPQHDFVADRHVAPAANYAQDFTVAPTGQHPHTDPFALAMMPYYDTEQQFATTTNSALNFSGAPAPQNPPNVPAAPSMQPEWQQQQSSLPYDGTGQQIVPTSVAAPDFGVAPASQPQGQPQQPQGPPQDPNAHLNPATKQALIAAMKAHQPQLFTPDIVAAFAAWKKQVQQAQSHLPDPRTAALQALVPLAAAQLQEVGFDG